MNTKRKKKTGLIPSQNALTFAAHLLRSMQHRGLRDAIVLERAGNKEGAKDLRLEADDYRQVATFLEERIIDKTR